MIRILLIGPLPPPMGGDTRHFLTLLEDLEANARFNVTLINTSRGLTPSNHVLNLGVALRTIFAIVKNLRRTDVISFHASDRGILHFGPMILALARLRDMPVILRVFGGSFAQYYQSRGNFQRRVLKRLLLSADAMLMQTKHMIKQLEKHVPARLEWFSTYIRSASRAERAEPSASNCERFVFLGHVARKKGIETILEAAPQLPEGCSIDIYGPLDEYTESELNNRGQGRVCYRGFLSHDEVNDKLWDYDCLVLPTFHHGEGYPGVIAEAYAHALPVITTNWMAIPEIVNDESGILVDPQDTAAFVAAVRILNSDSDRWQKLREGANRKAQQFNHAVWSKRFEEICDEVIAQRKRADYL